MDNQLTITSDDVAALVSLALLLSSLAFLPFFGLVRISRSHCSLVSAGGSFSILIRLLSSEFSWPLIVLSLLSNVSVSGVESELSCVINSCRFFFLDFPPPLLVELTGGVTSSVEFCFFFFFFFLDDFTTDVVVVSSSATWGIITICIEAEVSAKIYRAIIH